MKEKKEIIDKYQKEIERIGKAVDESKCEDNEHNEEDMNNLENRIKTDPNM